jgi:hypothetical protein
MWQQIMWFPMPLLGGGGRGDGTVEENWSTVGGVIQCFRYGRREEVTTPISEGKGACKVALGSHVEGRAEDAMAQRWLASELTQSGRQRVGLIGPKGCLS